MALNANARLTAALLIALVLGLCLNAAPAAADVPPGFGGAGGGTITIDLPGDADDLHGNIFGLEGASAGITVELWFDGEMVASTITDNDGDYQLTPPGFGGAGGGTIHFYLPGEAMLTGGTALQGSSPLSNAQVQWLIEGEPLATTLTSTEGDYLLTPPGFGGAGGGTV